MGAKTGIEWTDATWNPLRGCARVSEGCRNCYAEKVAYRFSGSGQPYEGLAVLRNGHASWTGKVELVEKHMLDPLKWRQPKRIFVNSMSDLFHENVPDEWIDRIFAVMALCPQHTFQILTKRPERMLAYLTGEHAAPNGDMTTARGECSLAFGRPARFFPQAFKSLPLNQDVTKLRWPLPNVWLGVSVENQATADERVPLLLSTPAAVRFVSAEPLLGSVNLECTDLRGHLPGGPYDFVCPLNSLTGWNPGDDDVPGLDWVICGGESGADARPMHPDWARSLRDQCVSAGVPFFFKQHGEWISLCDYDCFVLGKDTKQYEHRFAWRNGAENQEELPISCFRVGKKAAGAMLDGREWREFPEVRP